ncbi:MAG: hypothetical protein WCB68_15200 [Pyrinomonadaceae bacterium]
MNGEDIPNKNLKEVEYYKSYAEFSKTLRTWFVAYGIGGPVVLLSNDAAWATLKKSSDISFIGFLFLLGGALQILSALLNKHSMWYLYFGEFNANAKKRCSYKISHWYSDQGWIDVLLDIVTIILFGCATLLTFSEVMTLPADLMVPPLK